MRNLRMTGDVTVDERQGLALRKGKGLNKLLSMKLRKLTVELWNDPKLSEDPYACLMLEAEGETRESEGAAKPAQERIEARLESIEASTIMVALRGWLASRDNMLIGMPSPAVCLDIASITLKLYNTTPKTPPTATVTLKGEDGVSQTAWLTFHEAEILAAALEVMLPDDEDGARVYGEGG